MAADAVPEPLQSSHFTPCSRICLAIPYDVEPMVPATCAPCPMQSVLLESSKVARPPKFGWVASIPESMMHAFTPLPVWL